VHINNRLLQPLQGCFFWLPLLDADPARNQQRINLAAKPVEVVIALKRQTAHTVNPPVNSGFLSTDYLDIVERLAAHRAVGRSENVDRTHQIHLTHGRESEEHNAFSFNIRSHDYCLLITVEKVDRGSEVNALEFQ
jgi:hypothetical protein